jgi:predicted RNA-binding protein Jag
MNSQERALAVFTRMSRLVVKKHLKASTQNSYDYVGNLVNNMQMINQTLMTAAVYLIKRVRDKNEVNVEELTADLRRVIHGSVAEYAQSV